MICFKEIKTPAEAAAVYKSIQNDVAEFEPNETNENLAKSYALAQEEIIDELLEKIRYLETQIGIRDNVIVELKSKIYEV